MDHRRQDKDRRRRKRLDQRGRHPRQDARHPPSDAAGEHRPTLATGLDEEHPLSFLAQVSGLWCVLTMPAHLRSSETPDASAFVESLIGTPEPQTTAILTALAEFATDELLERRIRRELARRHDPLPRWLTALPHVEVVGVELMTDPLEDGDQYIVELRWPDGIALTLTAFIDRNVGMAVKDSLVIPGPRQAIGDFVSEQGVAEGLTLGPTDPADARAHVQEAIDYGSMMYPPFESDSWPQARPLLEWALRKLPAGGHGYERIELDEHDRDAIAAEFLASPHARRLDPVAASMVDELIWYAAFNCGDPYRWSPVKVEVLLTDWWHRKVLQPADMDRRLPGVLRAFVRWCAERKGLPARHLRETLDAVDRWEPAFRAGIGTPRRNTATELARNLAGMLLEEELESGGRGLDDAGAEASGERGWLDILADAVGGLDVLEALDTVPLPDEEFDFSGVPDDIHQPVGEMLALVDGYFPDDVELRTSARRILRRAAVGDPALFRRKASPRTGACAVCHLALDTNALVGVRTTGKALAAAFGLSYSPHARIATFADAVRPGSTGERWKLGDVSLLTSERKGELIRKRELWRTFR